MGATAQAGRRPASARPGLDLRGRVGAGPDAGVWLHTSHIGQPQRTHAGSEGRIGPVAGIHEDYPGRDLGLKRRPDLIERDLRLGLEGDAPGHAGLGAAHRIDSPVLREIEPIGDRQAGFGVGQRKETATWQLSCLPSWPQDWRVTPTECRPFLGKLVSSMIHASTGPLRSRVGRVSARTLARTASSDQADWPTKCSNDWCWAATREGAVTAAIGSTLLRSAGMSSPVQ